MPEEERLSLVSEVEDQFTKPLQRLENALDDVDDAIRRTGRGRDHVRIDVEANTGDAIAELEAFDAAIETLDDDVHVDATVDSDSDFANATEPTTAPVGGDGVDVTDGERTALTGGGVDRQSFTVENIDEWGESVEPFLDREALGRRGGEVTRVDELLDRDIEHVVEFDEAVDLAIDDDSDIDMNTLQGVTSGGPSEFTQAVEALDDEDATLLGRGGLSKDVRRFRRELDDIHPTMRGFHETVASAIPLIAVFVAALPAALVGIGALATAAIGAAGALAGIGALGLAGISLSETGELRMEPITNRLSAIGDAYLDAFAPLARNLAPVMEDALSSIELMAGPLADASAGLLAFRDEFQAFTGWLTSTLPSFTEDLLAFTHAAMPLVSGVIESIAGVDWFGYFANQLQRAWPALVALGSAITNILPFVVNLSQGFLVAAGGIATVVGAAAGLMNHFPMLTAALGTVAAGMLTVVSASALWGVVTDGLIGRMIGLAGTILTTAIPALNAHMASMLGVAAASWQAYLATSALLGVLTLGAAPILGSLASGFNSMGGNISDARKELKKFANDKNALNSDVPIGGSTPTSSASNAYVDNSTTVINAGNRDDAARQQYSSEYTRRQQVDSVFSG